MQAISYIREFAIHLYKILFRNRNDGFIHNFKSQVMHKKFQPDNFKNVKVCLKKLGSNSKLLKSKSPGAGSRKNNGNMTVAGYARLTSVNRKKGLLLAAVASFYKPGKILELGTSFGISTLYLNAGSPASPIITIEGNSEVAGMASECFALLGLKNIRVISGNFDDWLNELSGEVNKEYLVFIDGNHTYEATIRYFNAFINASVIVFDDIRWSGEMMKAWKQICDRANSHTIIDLFDIGIIISGGIARKYFL